MAKAGDTVKVITENETITGQLMPTPEQGITVIKLDSGYNIGIDNTKIKKTELVRKLQPTSQQQPATSQKKGLPKITILHTGGTIASKVDYSTGAVIAKFSPEELLEMFPELKKIANIKSRLTARISSEMIRFAHYNLIAKEVEKELKKGADGIIITHGTDTLHYTSAALAFMLENCPVPVILVGAQRSSDRGSSDAGLNLINAAYFIANSDFCGVAICMHETTEDKNCLILPPLKTRKMHTSRRDAFRPVNTTAIARVNYEEKNISFITKDYCKKDSCKDCKLKLKLMNEKLKIGVLKTHTNMFAQQFLTFKNYDGLVIEGTGLGHLPNEQIDKCSGENKKIFEAVKKLAKKMPVVMTSQCIYGRINMNVYTPGREIQEAGITGNLSDMTPETAFIKLAWLLSNHKKQEIKELITKDLRGEISERTEKQAFLI